MGAGPRDVVAVQRVIGELLLDAATRSAWEADPKGFAAARLDGAAERTLIANLDPKAIAVTAEDMARKRG